MVKGKSLDESAFDEIEEAVVLADAGLDVAGILVGALKEGWKTGRIKTDEDLKAALVDEIEKLLLPVEKPLRTNGAAPFVILTLGVNGVGKTTTIAKLAKIFRDEQKTVLLGACDTFRAAAIEQLEIWGERLGIETIKHQEDADPAAVAYDAAKAARARGADVLILDTAGRLHTKVNLMEEMRKIKRVVGRELEGAPHETLLVVDATNGQNVIAQAETLQRGPLRQRHRHHEARRHGKGRLRAPHSPYPQDTHTVRGGGRADGRPGALQGEGIRGRHGRR